MGAIPENWELLKFGNLLSEPTRNGIYKPKDFHGRGVKIINMGELFGYARIAQQPLKRLDLTSKEVEKFEVRKGDLLFARRSLVAEGAGKCSIVDQDGEKRVFESSIIRARLDFKKYNPEFYFYFFRSQIGLHQLDTIRRQVAVAGITGSDLISLTVPVPPLPEQTSIVKILSNLEKKIELNQKMNKTLEAIAQAIFKHWFIDFEFPNEEGKPYKSSGGEMVDSELGEMPKGWKIGRIKDVAKVKSGKRPIERSELKTETFSVELIGASSVMGYTKDYLFSENLVIIGRVGTHGVIQRTFRPSWPSDNTLVFITRNLEYIFQVLKRVEYEALNVGSTQPLITQSQMENFEIIIPSKTILDVFENLSMIIYNKISTANVESENLSSILSLILPRLMSGKIRAPLEE